VGETEMVSEIEMVRETEIAEGRWRYRYKAMCSKIKYSYSCINILAHRCSVAVTISDADRICRAYNLQIIFRNFFLVP
jgi:hypothetical protein